MLKKNQHKPCQTHPLISHTTIDTSLCVFVFCLKLHDLPTGNINLTPRKGFKKRSLSCLRRANLSPLSVDGDLMSM